MAKKPFIIVAFIDGPGIGDILDCSANAAIVKLHIPDAVLIACVTARSGVYSELSLLNPHIDHLLVADGGVSIDDLMDAHYAPAGYMPDEVRSLLVQPDLVLIPQMMTQVLPLSTGAVLSPPEWIADDAKEDLIAKGLDSSRWFACLHVREDGFRSGEESRDSVGKAVHPRSVYDIAPYVELIDYIIEEQGGQVVRIGDASMTPIQPRKGLLDLTTEDTDFLFDSFVVSRARYMVATDSGPKSLAFRLDTPTGVTNKASPSLGASTIHVIATKIFSLEDGSQVKGRAAAEAGCLSESEWYGRLDQITETPVEDLKLVADELFDATADRPLWSPSTPMTEVEGGRDRILNPIDLAWHEPLNFLGDR